MNAPSAPAERRIVIGVSSSALFDLKEADKVFRERGMDAYREYQIANEAKRLKPGSAFALVQKLQRLNEALAERRADMKIEIILLSRNSADTGLRVFKSIEAHKLGIRRAAFCSGDNPHRYIKAFACNLFLSTEAADASAAIEMGFAAARMLAPPSEGGDEDGILRVAFDGDAVIFDDEPQSVYETKGKEEFRREERRRAAQPIGEGPFRNFLLALQEIQQALGEDASNHLRTAIITARDAPAHERPILTLREWGMHVDEVLFLGGDDKGDFLKSFRADIFFDDQSENCESAVQENIPAGQVPRPRVVSNAAAD